MQLKITNRRPTQYSPTTGRGNLWLVSWQQSRKWFDCLRRYLENNSALLIYAEKDRVELAEGILRISKEIDDDEYINTRIVAVALTGSSPNGAVPANTAQTFTNPSGNSTYTEPANATPLNHTFRDFRHALNFEWDMPINNNLRGTLGGNYSKEYDYVSTGISASLSQDVNQRNTTLTLGISVNNDTWDPVSGVPVGFAAMPPAPAPARKSTDGKTTDKTIKEILFGVTQIINRQTLMQVNYSWGEGDGYLTDPYKIISVLANDDAGNLRASNPYVYENRPDRRNYQSLFWKGVYQFENDSFFNESVLNISYRYFWDDWGVQSHTIDARYHFDFNDGHYLQPHLRYYTQGKADFYRQTIIDGEETTLAAASADYRLGKFVTETIGLKYGYGLENGAEINFRIEMITQKGKDQNSDVIGVLQNQKLFPDNDAFLIQGGVSLDSISLLNTS